ncbi:hypothetical protein RB653_006185 [Dictyostelium firmibasis]|uniref:CAAX prenyl protease 2/Lysostaphin resistance protein A-like domain-containing protein n=1 Tax=Dictyostelium firmibasis TaxID=79012 RepID=A0AAN7Z1T4_9MYCE
MFIDNIIDYCSSRLNYNKRYMKWDLVNHPLTSKDKRFWFLLIMMTVPTIEMAIFIHVMRNIYIAIVAFHVTIILVPIIYLFINSKLIDSSLDNSRYNQNYRNENYDLIVNKFNKTTLISNSANSSSKQNNKNNKNKKINNNDNNDNNLKNDNISIGGKKYKSNLAIYDDIDNINDTDYLIDIYSKQDQFNLRMSLPTKIFKSLFSLPQFIIGLIILVISLSFGSLFYYLFSDFIPNTITKLTQYGLLNYSFNMEYIFYIYFSIVNPIIEEWWWRCFLPNTFGSSKLHKVVITTFYALYHFTVLIIFYNVYISSLATLIVFIGGWLFVYITKYVGPLASILAHCGADIIIVFIISNMTLNWFPYLHYNY